MHFYAALESKRTLKVAVIRSCLVLVLVLSPTSINTSMASTHPLAIFFRLLGPSPAGRAGIPPDTVRELEPDPNVRPVGRQISESSDE